MTVVMESLVVIMGVAATVAILREVLAIALQVAA